MYGDKLKRKNKDEKIINIKHNDNNIVSFLYY